MQAYSPARPRLGVRRIQEKTVAHLHQIMKYLEYDLSINTKNCPTI